MSLSSLLSSIRKASSIISFFDPVFLVLFLPFSIIGYFITPEKQKKYFLLLVSYLYFWLISGTLIVYLIVSTISVFCFGLWLEHIQIQLKSALAERPTEERKTIKQIYIRKQRRVIFFAVALHIGTLLILKYSPFVITNVNRLLLWLNVSTTLKVPEYLLPIGISFFSLQALSYILDVSRGTTKADHNFFRLALFLSFFPQIVEGPICRYRQTAENLWDAKPVTYQNLTRGLQRFLYGLMKKMVIADRLNPFVNRIFTDYSNHRGGVIALAALCYTIQLYMDFSGSMDAVIGVAQIFGITLPENFQRPFFAKTVSEFWTRWHITLGTWFKDYLFYPVVSTKRMKKLTSSARKKIGNHYGPLLAGGIALFCVWFCNGLWHGSDWNFLFFGMYHFVLILGGSLLVPLVESTNKYLHLNPEWPVYKFFQMLRTTIFVIIGELFFRAEGLKNGLLMFRKIFTDFSFSTLNEDLLFSCGLNTSDFLIVGITLVIVFIVSIFNEKGLSVRKMLAEKNTVLRWTVLYALIVFILLFGAYGFGYTTIEPLYGQY